MDEMTLTLNSPITEEQWDMLEDVDFDHTDSITFCTKHGKEVEFVKRKKGKWESFLAYGKTVRHRCSECLAVAARDDFGKEYLSDYCTVCGSDMRGVPS